jgi:hypothetical protein
MVQFTVIYPHKLSTTVISMKIDNFLDMFSIEISDKYDPSLLIVN